MASQLFENSSNDTNRGKTILYINVRKQYYIKKIDAFRTYIVESANYSLEYSSINNEEDGGDSGPIICKTEELFDPEKKFIVDGKFTVKVNGVFIYETIFDNTDKTKDQKIKVDGNLKLENKEVIPVAIDELQKWEGGELGDEIWTKDFTIIAENGKEIKVHKLILQSRSDVFAAMLNSNLKESIENKVEIPDFAYNVVETAVKLIYHCTFTTSLSMDELVSLLQFLDKYNLSSLTAKVEPFLINQISSSNVVYLTNCSLLTNSFKLKEKCVKFLLIAIATKIPLADIDILDKDIHLETIYQIVETER